jgi:hypothetical protein
VLPLIVALPHIFVVSEQLAPASVPVLDVVPGLTLDRLQRRASRLAVAALLCSAQRCAHSAPEPSFFDSSSCILLASQQTLPRNSFSRLCAASTASNNQLTHCSRIKGFSLRIPLILFSNYFSPIIVAVPTISTLSTPTFPSWKLQQLLPASPSTYDVLHVSHSQCLLGPDLTLLAPNRPPPHPP